MSAARRYDAGILGHDRPTELRRLRLRERAMDPITRRIILARGLETSWRCLELGAGTGSVAKWLARRCPAGCVLATDLDTRHLVSLRQPNLDVLRHDVVHGDFPDASFDLVHARSLLVNVPERDEVLPKLARWLAPGGWVVLEEPCLVLHDSSPHPAFRRLVCAYESALALSHGADTRWPRRLPSMLHAAGLREVGMEATAQIVGDDGAADQAWRTAFAQGRGQTLAFGLLTETEYDEGVALFDEPSFVEPIMLLISAWGRRSSGAGAGGS